MVHGGHTKQLPGEVSLSALLLFIILFCYRWTNMLDVYSDLILERQKICSYMQYAGSNFSPWASVQWKISVDRLKIKHTKIHYILIDPE